MTRLPNSYTTEVLAHIAIVSYFIFAYLAFSGGEQTMVVWLKLKKGQTYLHTYPLTPPRTPWIILLLYIALQLWYWEYVLTSGFVLLGILRPLIHTKGKEDLDFSRWKEH